MKKIALGFSGLMGVVLSVSGAIAVADTRVTSQDYVEARLNTKENVSNKKTTLTDSETEYPSTSAVKNAIDAAKSELQGTIDSIPLGNYELVANKKQEINSTTRTTTNYPSVKAIADYVDAEILENLADKEDTYDARYPWHNTVQSGNPSVATSTQEWKKLIEGSYTTIKTGANVEIDVNPSKITTEGAAIPTNGAASNLVTAGAVYNYITSLPSANYPARNTNCSANSPCALIDDGTSFGWVPIVQAP